MDKISSEPICLLFFVLYAQNQIAIRPNFHKIHILIIYNNKENYIYALMIFGDTMMYIGYKEVIL